MLSIPAKSWDCHVHVFDPARFPFRRDRSYTPAPASVKALVQDTLFDCIVIVQASPEDGEHGLVAQLQEAKAKYPEKTFRASILTEDIPGRDVAKYDQAYIDTLHDYGVRSVRIQGSLNSFSSSGEELEAYIYSLARSYAVTRYRWAISIQMPLRRWASLHDILTNKGGEMDNLMLIAEHGACATPDDINTDDFRSFLNLLRSGQAYVKISALYRRALGEFQRAQCVVQAFAEAAPERILWGTDWPHVDLSKPGLEPTMHHADANWRWELAAVRGWLSEAQWLNLLVRNPARLYA